MTTIFTVTAVTALVHKILAEDYGVTPAGGNLQTGGSGGLSQAQVQALIDTAVAALPATGVTLAQVEAAVQQAMVDAGPAIQAAVASQVGKLTDKVTFNVSTAGDSPFVVETNNFTGAQHKVGVDFVTQRDGEVTVNGKRVLTVDDALEAAGGGIDQAAVAAAVAAATSSLSARVLQLEADMAERVTMANVQGLLTGYAAAQSVAELTGRVTELEGSTALRQARWVTEALTGDTTANATQINTAVAGLARTAFVQEQFANFNDLLSADINQTAQLALAEQAKLQAVMDVFGSKTGSSVADVKNNWEGLAQYAQSVENWANQTIGEVVEYIAVELEALKAAIAALPTGGSVYGEWIAQALTGTLGATLAEVNRAVEALARKTDLAPYAKTTDTEQIITAKSIVVDGIKVAGGVLTYVDDEYGNRLRLIDPGVTDVADMGIVVVHHDLAEILAPSKRGGEGLELVDLVTEDMLKPQDSGWQDLTIIAGTVGTLPVQARRLGDMVYLKGDLKYTYSSSGTYVDVARLPDGIPAPNSEVHVPVYGIESGVSYRVGLCRVQPSGLVQIAAPTGKVTAVSFGNICWSAV